MGYVGIITDVKGCQSRQGRMSSFSFTAFVLMNWNDSAGTKGLFAGRCPSALSTGRMMPMLWRLSQSDRRVIRMDRQPAVVLSARVLKLGCPGRRHWTGKGWLLTVSG